MTVKRYAADEASYRVGDGLGVVDGRGVPVRVGVAVRVGVVVRVAVTVGVGVAVLVGVDVLVAVAVRVGVGVAFGTTVQPISSNAAQVMSRKLLPVSMGSISSSGVSVVSQCDTDEPGSCGFGAYICTWVPTFPAER